MTKDELIKFLANERDECRRRSYRELEKGTKEGNVNGQWFEGKMAGLNYAIAYIGELE